jgi:hypothetical protein
MRIDTDVNVPSGTIPTGITADVRLESEVSILVFRAWDNPQWYIYDVAFGGDRWGGVDHNSEAGIGNLDDRYPVPVDSELGRALERAAEKVRGEYAPA